MRYFLKKFKGALITALVFVLLLGFIYLRDTEKNSENLSEESLPFDLNSEKVISVEIYYPNSWILLESEGEDWFLVQDEQNFNADEKLIERFIKDVSNTEVVGTVPTNEVDLDQFGLENAKAELVILTDIKDYRFIVGDKIQIGTGTYVYLPEEKKVLVVEKGYLKQYLNMSAIDFRDKALLDFDSSRISRIYISSGGFSADIYKDEEGWYVDDQDQTIADEKKLKEILWVFSRAKVLDFENETPEGLKKYGLEEPNTEIRFYEDDRIHGLMFGKRKDEDSYYIKSDSDNAVYSIHKSLFKKIPKNVDQIGMK